MSQAFVRDSLFDTAHTLALTAETLAAPILEASDLLIRALEGGHTLFFCGNGGSAADSQHLATELVSKFRVDRPGLPAIALTTDTSTLTAIANDYAYERVFARQVEALGRQGDVLVGISTSGGSGNVLAAVQAARTQGMGTLGLLGNGGGAIGKACDLALVVPSGDTARIQEAHIAIGHILCDLLERHFAQRPLASQARRSPMA